MRGIADQKLNVEAKVRYVLEIIHEQISVAGQPEWSAVVLNLVVNVASELIPILPVQTADVGTVEIGKRRSRQMGLSLNGRPLRRIAQSTVTGEQGSFPDGPLCST